MTVSTDLGKKLSKDYPEKHFYPHCILMSNEPIRDKALALAFNWANEMGLRGKTVYSLVMIEPSVMDNPLSPKWSIWCKIECTEEEEKAFIEKKKNDVLHAIAEALE